MSQAHRVESGVPTAPIVSSPASTGEVVVVVNGVETCTEAVGNPRHPAMLLIQGACASMIYWEDDLCRSLAAAGRYVIRFDCRDQGPSQCYPPGEPPYDLWDLADDAVALLDHYGVRRAHVWGGSSGGIVGQLMAIRYPQRVASLVLQASTPEVPRAAHASAGTAGAELQLPPPTAAVQDLIQYLADVDWSDRAARVQASVREAHVVAGTRRFPVDDAAHRAYAEREYARQRNVLSFRFNTPIAETRTASWRSRLRDLRVPTLVMHGTEDPALPYPHGVALADEIPGASLLPLEGVGHGLPRGCWPTAVPAVVAHTSGE
jgi:pimeloyl-ACP methyl ester carboxylesterase